MVFSEIFRSLVTHGSAEGRGTPAPPAARSVQDAERDLQGMADEAKERTREAAAQAARHAGVNVGEGKISAGEEQKLIWRRDRDVLRDRLRAEIVELHARLGTGIGDQKLENLSRLLAAHAPETGAPGDASIDEQIEGCVVVYLFARAGEMAWDRLGARLTEEGLAWPVPDGLAERRSSADLDAVLEQHHAENRLDFLGASPKRISDLVRGEVAAWALTYPQPDSYLWRQTQLRAVAAGLRAQLFGATLEIWMWRPPELENRLLETLDRELAAARDVLGRGVATLAAAVDVASKVTRACREVIPEMVWSFVEPHLKWETVAGEPRVEALADGLSHIDPVCGMTLTAERVKDRVERDGATFYFCSITCRERFVVAPSKYVPEGEPPAGVR